MQKKLLLNFRWLSLCIGLLISQAILAQNRQVTGKVTDESDKSPIPGASVKLKGTNKGTTTDANGTYKISVDDNSELIFSNVGFQTKTVKVAGRTTVDVALPIGQILEEVVVKGAFGATLAKKSLGYSIQAVSGDEIQRAGEASVVSALQGKIAGAFISGSGGAPGAGTNIILRGVTSLGSGSDNQPLFVIDGIVTSNQTFSGNPLPSAGTNSPGSSEQFSNTNRAGDINPDDVESVSVLKGPAATALYGLRASNGAIIITTKRGKAGKTTVSLSHTSGIDVLGKSPAIQTRFIQGRLGEFISPTDPGGRSIFRSFGPSIGPTQDQIYDNFRNFYTTGVRNNTNVSVSGGNDLANYYTSINRTSQQGIVPGTDYNRYSFKLAGGVKMGTKLTTSGSLNYIYSDALQPPSGDKSVFSSISYWPNSYDINDYINPDGSQRNITFGVVDNPKYLLEKSPQKVNTNRFIGDLSFTYTPVSWLTAKYQVSLDYFNQNMDRAVDPSFDVGSQVQGFHTVQSNQYKELNSNFFLTVTKDFSPDLVGSLMVGNSIVDIQNPSSYTRGETQILPNFTALNNYKTLFYGADAYQKRLVSAFGQAKLSYKNYLFLDITGRNDWTSTLPVGNNSFFYPSVSLSAVLSDMFDIKGSVLSYAKLRASYAQVGKDTRPYNVGIYFNSLADVPINGQIAFTRSSSRPDPNLKPETTTSAEIGTELRFLKDRFRLDVTYFNMDSKNQIFSVPVSNASGSSRYVTNAGLINNQGVEILLGATIMKTKNFSWEANINWSKLGSKVITMPTGIPEITYADVHPSGLVVSRIVEGSSLGDLWGYDYKRDASGNIQIQTNGLPLVDNSKYIKLGNAFPAWQGGLTNNFTYKDVSLSFLWEWRNGGDVVDMAETNSIRNGIIRLTGNRYEQGYFNSVGVDGQPNTKLVYLDDNFYRSLTQSYGYYKYNIQDGSWVRLRNVSLGYSVSKKVLAKLPFDALRITFTANNLFLNTPFRGYDPESLTFGSGTNLIGYVGRNNPATRSFQLGINLTFK